MAHNILPFENNVTARTLAEAYKRRIVEEAETIRPDLLSIISEVVVLTPSGDGYKGLCPFHHELTPSFLVRPDKEFWFCFGCGAGGGWADFQALMQAKTELASDGTVRS